jgi:hypothetical protein
VIPCGDDPGAEPPDEEVEDFLSGSSGYVAGRRRITSARWADGVTDLAEAPQRLRLGRAAAAAPPRRRVLVLAAERTDVPNLLAPASRELQRSRHAVEVVRTEAGAGGKFENLNGLMRRHDPYGYDWLLLLDDDVRLPRGFLDRFLFLVERFDLAIAQPAHRRLSHAAWAVTRRQRGSVVRETAFVEVGPVVAFARRTLQTLLPFPPLRAGWGLDAHWSALAAARDWRIGVVDATAIEHVLRPVAASYDRAGAVEEGRRFLADRPYVPRSRAERTLVEHKRW